jgi:cytidylate kinase|tara:strand:+ start:12991 stop:13656 length:666 start_codon:yes stop_codon:yes gene_type:complete
MPENDRFHVIALDGGAASGKSSSSRELAARRHFLHIDTGAHYRAVTAHALEAAIEPTAGPELESLLADLTFETEISTRSGLLKINGKVPVDATLRTEAVNAAVSKFAAIPAVREAVKRYQKSQVEVARSNRFNGIIMDGRDIGSVILPGADLKLFLFADAQTREKRRQAEGISDAIAQRDQMDEKRKTAPLSATSDAIKIDNSNLSLAEVVTKIEELLDAL